MTTTQCYTLLVILSVAISRCSSQENELVYHVLESQHGNSYIGNLSVDSQLQATFSPEELGELQFAILTDTKLFNITKTMGILKTESPIDRETLCPSYTLICFRNLNIAVQFAQNNFFQIIRVKVIVDDDNDNDPKFPQATVSLEILESEISSSYPVSGALDNDTGVNAKIEYTLSQNGNKFGLSEVKKIDGNSDLSIDLMNALDRETEDFYQLLVLAKDGGSPQRTGTMTVNVQILDANDNRPTFKDAPYVASVKETYPINTIVLQINATDLDIGKNREITYHFSSTTSQKITNLFSLDNKTGLMRIAKELDYQKGDNYQFVVEAIDNGDPRLTAQTRVTISIIKDASNTRPNININTLTQDKVVKLSEDADIGKFVAHVAVVDNDLGNNGYVTCILTTDKFTLKHYKKNEYKVVVNQTLDRELQDKYEIEVSCADHGTPSLDASKMFTVKLMDANDNIPQFTSKNYMCQIMENNEIGEPVVQVRATDLDIGSNGEIQYKLHPDAGDLFAMQETTGVISANTDFDRENTPEIKFQVIVTDGGSPSMASTATVVVTITDVNDNNPEFSSPIISFSITKDTEPGGVVGVVSATDIDSGSNAIVTYGIVEGVAPEQNFVVESDGTIKLNRKLLEDEYHVTVYAKDYGLPPLMSEAVVTITVIPTPKIISPTDQIPNNTNMSKKGGTLSDENTTIVVAVAVITGVLSTAIIMAICIVKRSGRKKRCCCGSNNKKYETQTIHPNINASMKDLELVNAATKTKREVISTSEEHDTSAVSFSSFRAPLYCDANKLQKLQAPTTIVVGDKIFTDYHSDAVSDSGHGGSEEDMGSHRPYPPSDQGSPRQFLPHDAGYQQTQMAPTYWPESDSTRLNTSASSGRQLLTPPTQRSMLHVPSSTDYNRTDNSMPYRKRPHRDYPSEQDYADQIRNAGSPDIQTMNKMQNTHPMTISQLSAQHRHDMFRSGSLRDNENLSTASGSYSISPQELDDKLNDALNQRF